MMISSTGGVAANRLVIDVIKIIFIVAIISVLLLIIITWEWLQRAVLLIGCSHRCCRLRSEGSTPDDRDGDVGDHDGDNDVGDHDDDELR